MPVILARSSQQAAGYRPEGGVERCGYCRFFVTQGTCNRILGPVSPRGWCKYFSRMVYLRLDSGTDNDFTGAAPGATLDMSFMSSGNMPSGVTFTRASTATYVNSAGTMQTAATNVPRFDYNPSTRALNGLLIEEARTNLWLQSADASNAAWIKFGNVAAPPTVTANQTIAPDGALTAARVVYPAVTSGSSVLYQNFAITAATYTFSVYLKGAVGGEQLYISANSPFTNGGRITLTTAWQRFLVTFTGTAATWWFEIGPDLGDTGQSSTPAQTIYVWGAQVEAGAFPTSYIPTTSAAVTRSADVATIASIPGRNATAESYAAEFLLVTSQRSGATIVGDAATSNYQMIYLGAALNAGAWDGAGALTANTMTLGTVAKAASTWASPNPGSICLNAGTVASSATMTHGYGAVATVRLLCESGSYPANGYIRRFRYWPRALTNTEMQQVTT